MFEIEREIVTQAHKSSLKQTIVYIGEAIKVQFDSIVLLLDLFLYRELTNQISAIH